MVSKMEPVQSAVEPRRAVFVQGALATARVHVERARAALERAGWDLNVAAPAAHGRMRKAEYLQAKGYREFLSALTTLRAEGTVEDPRKRVLRVWSEAHVAKYLARIEDGPAQSSTEDQDHRQRFRAREALQPVADEEDWVMNVSPKKAFEKLCREAGENEQNRLDEAFTKAEKFVSDNDIRGEHFLYSTALGFYRR